MFWALYCADWDAYNVFGRDIVRIVRLRGLSYVPESYYC